MTKGETRKEVRAVQKQEGCGGGRKQIITLPRCSLPQRLAKYIGVRFNLCDNVWWSNPRPLCVLCIILSNSRLWLNQPTLLLAVGESWIRSTGGVEGGWQRERNHQGSRERKLLEPEREWKSGQRNLRRSEGGKEWKEARERYEKPGKR